MKETTIRNLAYELYKQEWKQTHLSSKRIRKSFCDCYAETKEAEKYLYGDEKPLSYEAYIEEYGYDGDIYSCYEEFLENEYLDHGYMLDLFAGPNMKEEMMEYAEDVIKLLCKKLLKEGGVRNESVLSKNGN